MLLHGPRRHRGRGRTYAYGDPIPVGAKGTIRTRVETSGFFDDKDTGANLITNDPSWPETNEAQFGLVPLKIHLKIIRRYVFKPASLVEMGRSRPAIRAR